MANWRRGEVAAVLDGRERTLCLTLGALAELEANFGADDLVGLAARCEGGKLSARDLSRVIACGLRGAGEAVSDAEVAGLRMEGGAAGFAALAAELIAAAFGVAEERDGENPPMPQPANRCPGMI